jgi:hypothetical protein
MADPFRTFTKEVLDVIRESDGARDLAVWSDSVGYFHDRAKELFGEDWMNQMDEIFAKDD